MIIKLNFDSEAFRARGRIWLWLSLTPSLVVDVLLIYRLIERLASINMTSQNPGSILVEFLFILLFNAVLLKSAPIIIYFVQRSHIKQSYVLIDQDEVVYYKRLWVGYEFDYNYTFYHEFHLVQVSSVKKRWDGSLVVFGLNQVHCYLQDGSQAMVFKKKELLPKIINRKRCVIPGVFEGMDKIQQKLEKL